MDYMASALTRLYTVEMLHSILNGRYEAERRDNDERDDDLEDIGDRLSGYLDEFQTNLQKIFNSSKAAIDAALDRFEEEVVVAHYRGSLTEDLRQWVHHYAVQVSTIRREIEGYFEILNAMENSGGAFGAAFETSNDRADAALNKWREAVIEYERRLSQLAIHTGVEV